MKKILIIFVILTFSFTTIVAQSIRKNYQEFTLQEMNDYVDAFNILFTNGTIPTFVAAHTNHVDEVHTRNGNNGELFLPWHRFFLNDIEQRMRATNSSYTYLSIPYWDWTADQNSASPTFWNNGFLNSSAFPAWGFSRNIGAICNSLPTVTDINNTMGLSTFFVNTTSKGPFSTDFSHLLEYHHDIVHCWVGGTMNDVSVSPGDPVFYIHHCMVDKVWQAWEDLASSFQSIFLTGIVPMTHYNTPEYPFDVTPNSTRDSRSLLRPAFAGSGRNVDIWFAENGKVLLDGANGSAFVATDATAAYTYRYTAATSAGSSTFGGSMYLGDIQKDGSGNVIDDNKGGFEINNSVKCNFLAGSEIIFRTGFWAKNGSEIAAKIITSPNEPAPLLRPIQSQMALQEESKEVLDVKVFPNPLQQKGTIQYSVKEIAYIEIILTDVLGKTIKVIENQIKYPGNYTTEIKAAYLPHGTYFCKISIGKHAKVFKMIK